MPVPIFDWPIFNQSHEGKKKGLPMEAKVMKVIFVSLSIICHFIMWGRRGLVCFFVLVAMAVPLALRVQKVFDLGKEVVVRGSGSCQWLAGPVGVEDCEQWTSSVLLCSSDDRLMLWNVVDGAQRTPKGSIIALYSDNHGDFQIQHAGAPRLP